MIYDLRTYLLRPRSAPEFAKRMEASLQHREKFSPLGGYWTTEVGTLNEVVHIWPYDSIAHAETVRAELTANPDKTWPPRGEDIILEMRSEYLASTRLMQDWAGPKRLGELYELRVYTYKAGTIDKVVEEWGKMLPRREKHSPVAGVWTSAQGSNKLYHLWPYKSMDERAKARTESVASGDWPPDTGEWMLGQANKLLIPASFSPMH